MGGGVDDYSTSFQAECLSSGSISLGRFESESLSWEKRSSFSHNRYLEEVEKYSTPGSVTEKKAYFEAHFKKKGLLLQNFPLSQRGSESQQNAYNNEDSVNHVDECEDANDDKMDFKELQFPGNDGVEFSWYDETPVISGDLKHDMTDDEGEEVSSIPQIPVEKPAEEEAASNNVDIKIVENVQSQVTSDLYLVKDAFQIEDEKEITGKVETSDDLSETKRMIPPKAIGDTDHALLFQKPKEDSSKMVENTSEDQKISHLTSGSQSNPTRIHQKPSMENKHIPSVQESVKTLKKVKKDHSPKANLDKQMHSRPLPSQTMNSSKKIIKAKVSGNIKAKGILELKSKSRKGLEDEKGVIPRSTSGTGENTTRPKQASTSVKAEPKASGSAFSFKSDERAEKRKEFYVKLEEKLQAKEAKRNEIKAKTQEDMETAMKQFRRSLNFKATPMPSFYHESRWRASSVKKDVSTPAKSSYRQNDIKLMRQDSSKRIEQDGSSSDPSNGYPQIMTTSDPLRSIQHCSTAVAEVAVKGSDKTEESVNVKVLQHCSKTATSKKEGKIRLQQQREKRKVKKDDKTNKARSSEAGKIMKGVGGGSVAVRVAS